MGRWTGPIRLRLDWALHRDRRSFRAFYSLIRLMARWDESGIIETDIPNDGLSRHRLLTAPGKAGLPPKFVLAAFSALRGGLKAGRRADFGNESLQFRVLRFGLLEDRDASVSVFPKAVRVTDYSPITVCLAGQRVSHPALSPSANPHPPSPLPFRRCARTLLSAPPPLPDSRPSSVLPSSPRFPEQAPQIAT